MKYILLGCILLITQNFADVTAKATPPEEKVKKDPSHSIYKRHKKEDRPYYLLNRDTVYYSNVGCDCDRYLRIIEEKEREIERLKNEINRLSGTKQGSLQQKLKEEYEMKIKKFDERKSGIGTQNSMRISNEPLKE